MSLSLNTIGPRPGSRTKKFRVGRGPGSGRGTTAGRGTKGQRARTGGRKGLRLKGLKQMLLGFPKMRGFQSLHGQIVTIPLTRLEQLPEGMIVSVKTLKERKLMPRSAWSAKIVGKGELKKKFTVKGVLASASAKVAIEKAGGSFVKVKKSTKKEKK